MDFTLTIEISAYNKEAFIGRCVDSIICDSFHQGKIEVIIVNDGSQDRTSEIAHLIQKQYPHFVIVVDKDNGHQGSCLNVALDIARGRYFKNLDGDDLLDPIVLDEVVKHLENSNVDMVVHGHTICRKEEQLIFPPFDGEFDLESLDFQKINASRCIGMHGVLFKTNIFRDNHIRLSENVAHGDSEYAYYPLKYCHKVLLIRKSLYMYQAEVVGQISGVVSMKHVNDYYYVFNKMLGDYILDNRTIEKKKTEEIILCRNAISYYGMVLLHFPLSTIERERIQKTLRLLYRHTSKRMFFRLLFTTTKKIPFVLIFILTKMSSCIFYKCRS